MVAAPWRKNVLSGSTSAGRRSSPGLVARDGTVGRTIEVPTPDGDAGRVLAAIDGVVDELLGDGAAAVGFGVPLNLDRRTGVAHRAINLPLEQRRFRRPGAASASASRSGSRTTPTRQRSPSGGSGAGRGRDRPRLLTLGTGVGGGIVLDGRLYRGWAELGHVVVVADGEPCQGTCHGRGHLEAVASGLAADRAARDALRGGRRCAPARRAGARPATRGAVAAVARIGQSSRVAIGSLANIFDPEVVIVGGGFGAAAGDLLLEAARDAARREAITPADEQLRIVPAELGDEAGLVGAALVGFEALDGER